MKLIPLTHGQFAMIDDEDFERVAKFKWIAVWKERARTWYAQRMFRFDGKPETVYLARFIMGLKKGNPLKVDHRDHNGINNQKINLRVCTNQQNTCGKRRHKPNASGLPKGVIAPAKARLQPRPFGARINVKGCRIILGFFKTKEEAAARYLAAASEYFGEHANF
jgi:hypothetical protein